MSADAADWIADVVTERCPGAIRCADPFHVVAWATEALDAERRRAWNDARALARTEPKRGPGRPRKDSAPPPAHERVRKLKGARYALWKNPDDLTDRQTAKLAWIAKTDTRLYRAYLLKEGLRHVFSVKGEEGKQALDRWISWARRCRIPVFVELAGRIVRHRQAIDAALDHGLSQGLIESTNTKIRVLTRVAFGFHSAEALIALAMLALGGHRPALPGREHPRSVGRPLGSFPSVPGFAGAHAAKTQPRTSESPSGLTLTGTTSPSCTSPASSILASWSPMACWISRRSGRAP